MSAPPRQLISYIAPGAPGTRRPATGTEPFLRLELSFTPKWYRAALGIDFGARWHTDPAYRRETVLAMRSELDRRFPGADIGRMGDGLDLLTGTYGAGVVAGIYGVPLVYAADNWPNCEHQYLSDDAVDRLGPPDLDANPLFTDLMAQVDWIASHEGRVEGFINWQGILNNANRLRGETLFMDMMCAPDRCRRLLDCVCTTMIDGAKRLHERQRATGFDVRFFTVSNCLVNMVSPEQYRDLLLPYDMRIAEEFGCIGIHNCAWNADPYIDDYARVPGLAYIDMGMDSDLVHARAAIPDARRAIMYTPMDAANKPLEAIREDFERIARDYGPCDIVAADIEAGTPDERVQALIDLCAFISDTA
jgi:hypothetical protein